MRKYNAYMLIEMLLILALIVVILLLSAAPMRLFFRGVLGTQEVFDCQLRLETLLEQLRFDTENADLAYVLSADARLGGDVLCLSGPAGVALYQFGDAEVTCIRGDDAERWDFPRMTIDWQVLTPGPAVQAVAIRTQQQRLRQDDATPTFRGSRVFVVNLNSMTTAKEQP